MPPILRTGLCLAKVMAKPPCISILRTLVSSTPCRSALAPTFSSTGDTAKIVSRLGPTRISTMIMTGKPNRPFPPEFQVELDQFLPGAVSAVGLVTSCVSSGDWAGLEGLVDRDCITSLQASMATMDKEQTELVAVNPGDVFLSFVSNPENCDSGNNLHLVTFSLPRLEEIRTMVTENKELSSQTHQQVKESIAAVEKDQIKDTVAGLMGEYQSKISSNDPHALFQANEIVIGNYRFVRDSPDSQWTITEVSQINSLQAWATIFKLRWKGRLGIATRGGYEFYTILRYDYMTDYIAISMFTAFYIFQLIGTGVITAPHS
eukprot:GFUD01040983.1.p1 GENE.GFUD01040983.1~~GFUD01040983.1.p1  ORF type:complete len:338 (+),score=99.79 GFUD01040983.1:58-1014(+)